MDLLSDVARLLIFLRLFSFWYDVVETSIIIVIVTTIKAGSYAIFFE